MCVTLYKRDPIINVTIHTPDTELMLVCQRLADKSRKAQQPNTKSELFKISVCILF